jgi:hypothetical protein
VGYLLGEDCTGVTRKSDSIISRTVPAGNEHEILSVCSISLDFTATVAVGLNDVTLLERGCQVLYLDPFSSG